MARSADFPGVELPQADQQETGGSVEPIDRARTALEAQTLTSSFLRARLLARRSRGSTFAWLSGSNGETSDGAKAHGARIRVEGFQGFQSDPRRIPKQSS